MGGYQHHNFTTYLVSWPDELVIKAGVTESQRWRGFCLRGAVVEMLHIRIDPTTHVWQSRPNLEANLHAQLGSLLTPAFESSAQAEPMLGKRGGGYLECFRADSEPALRDALASCVSIMRAHPNGHCSKTLPAHMHGRTHGRTHVEPPSQRDLLEACDACEANGDIRADVIELRCV